MARNTRLITQCTQSVNDKLDHKNHNEKYSAYYDAMSTALNYHTAEINNIIKNSSADGAFSFAGIDSSTAPSKLHSIYEKTGLAHQALSKPRHY